MSAASALFTIISGVTQGVVRARQGVRGCNDRGHGIRTEQDLSPDLGDHRVSHDCRRRQGQGAQGGGPARHRLRSGRARLPDARLHRRGRGSRLRRAQVPEIHRGRRAARAARGRGGQDRAGQRLRCRAEPGADHQRRQAGRLRGLRHPARPRRRGPDTHAVLDHLPGVHRAGGRRPGARDDRREHRLPGQRRAARGVPHRSDQDRCCSSRRPTRPAPSTRPSRSPRSAAGPPSRACG